MQFYFKDGKWQQFPAPRTFNIYSKVGGELAQWVTNDHADYRKALRDVMVELGPRHRGAVLAVIK